MLLEPIYEEEFYDFSFGFRPGKSPHQALKYLRDQCFEQDVAYVLDVDIRKYFDSIDHAHLREILHRRVGDGVITRLINKWLKAGVWEEGLVQNPEVGSPQGGVISPLLSNAYLHGTAGNQNLKASTSSDLRITGANREKAIMWCAGKPPVNASSQRNHDLRNRVR